MLTNPPTWPSNDTGVRLVLDNASEIVTNGGPLGDGNWHIIGAQRILDIAPGVHSIKLQVGTNTAGTASVHGSGALATCIGFTVLGT